MSWNYYFDIMFSLQRLLIFLSSFVSFCYTSSACYGNINLNGIKKLYQDRCVSGIVIGDDYGHFDDIIGASFGLSLMDCVENCLRTKGCSSIQYSRTYFRCLKSTKNISSDIPDVICRGEVSSARDHWTEGYPDPCQSAECLTGSICSFNLYENVTTCEIPVTCEIPLLKRPNAHNLLHDCDGSGRKIRFMSKTALQNLASLDNVCSSNDEIVVRLKVKSTQKEVVLAQHSLYSSELNLTFLLNNHTNFHVPNTDEKPYFYLGFLPISKANIMGVIQGYRANGIDFEFKNCDANSNSYIVFYTGNQTIPAIGKRDSFMEGWITNSIPVASERYLPDEYFMEFEMHMGGCGGHITSQLITPVPRAAVGCIIRP